MQIKLIVTTKNLHLASFWRQEFLELRSGLLYPEHDGQKASLILYATTKTIQIVFFITIRKIANRIKINTTKDTIWD